MDLKKADPYEGDILFKFDTTPLHKAMRSEKHHKESPYRHNMPCCDVASPSFVIDADGVVSHLIIEARAKPEVMVGPLAFLPTNTFLDHYKHCKRDFRRKQDTTCFLLPAQT